MSKRDFALALFVVIIWGANFTVIKLGLDSVPSMLLVALRYTFTALPAVFFIKRPAVKWRYIIANGTTVGVGQFSCLFYAIQIGMPAGIASVVLQAQAFFTILFSIGFLGERLTPRQAISVIVAVIGLYFIGANAYIKGEVHIPPLGFFLTLLAAAFWAMSNTVTKFAANNAASQGERLDMFGWVVWSSLVPPFPMLALALAFDKPQRLLNVVTHLNARSIFAVLYLSLLATFCGYGIWSVLLSKYPAGRVAPLSVLVPVTGLVIAQIVLGERLSTQEWIGGLIVLISLLISTFRSSPKRALVQETQK